MFALLVISLCLFINAVLSCLEMAFVTVSRPHLKQLAAKGNSAAKRILRLRETPERTLSVLQIGITLVGAISAAIGGAGAEESLTPYLMVQFPITIEVANGISIGLIVVPLTYFSVVIGELVPKSLALKFPMKLALSGGLMLQALDKFFSPFVFILEVSTKFFLRMISMGVKAELTVHENTAIDIEPLSDVNKQYVLNQINIDKRTVKDIFVPWEEVSTISTETHFLEIMQKIKDFRHTRIPVVDEGAVIGLLHAKEFVSESEIARLDWKQLIRPVVKLNPKEPILSALKKLQSKQSHLAVIMEDKSPIGIVTMEDIFEEVVGDISDEDDNPRLLLSSNSKIRTMHLGDKK